MVKVVDAGADKNITATDSAMMWSDEWLLGYIVSKGIIAILV